MEGTHWCDCVCARDKCVQEYRLYDESSSVLQKKMIKPACFGLRCLYNN